MKELTIEEEIAIFNINKNNNNKIKILSLHYLKEHWQGYFSYKNNEFTLVGDYKKIYWFIKESFIETDLATALENIIKILNERI
jgi:hypothetical protein